MDTYFFDYLGRRRFRRPSDKERGGRRLVTRGILMN